MGFLAPLSLALGAIGTGVSFIGGMQQARAASAIAEQNAAIARMNAVNEAESMRAQAAIQQNQTRQNFQFRQAEAGQAFANAGAKRSQAAAQDAVNAENLRVRREEGRRLQAAQSAKFAAAGIVESTGSPLSLAAATAGLIQRDLAATQYQQELAQTGLLHEAGMERLGGQFAMAGATMDAGAGRAEAGLRVAAASARLASGNREADLMRSAGMAQSAGARFSAFGNLLGSAGSLYGQHLQFKQLGAYS